MGLVSQRGHHELPQTGCLKITDVYFPAAQARNPKSNGKTGHVPSEDSRGGAFLAFLACGVDVVSEIPWLVGTLLQSHDGLPVSLPPLHVCIQFVSSYKDTSHWI